MGTTLSLHAVPCCCYDGRDNILIEEPPSEQQGVSQTILALVEQRLQAQGDQRIQAVEQRVQAQVQQRVQAQIEQRVQPQVEQRIQAQVDTSAARAELLLSQLASGPSECDAKLGEEQGASASQGGDLISAVLLDIPQREISIETSSFSASQLAARRSQCDSQLGGEHGASTSRGGDLSSAVLADIPQKESAAEASSFLELQDNEEATIAVQAFQDVEDLSRPRPVIAQDHAEIIQDMDDVVSQMAGKGAELVEATPRGSTMVVATFDEVEGPLLLLPVDVPKLDESTRQEVSSELAEASEQNIAVGNQMVKAVVEEKEALWLTGNTIELGEQEDHAVLVQQAEAMLEPLVHDSVELARKLPDHVAAISQPDERPKEVVPPLSENAASADEIIQQDAQAIAQLVEGMEEVPYPRGEWDDLCDCDGLSDGEDTMEAMASAQFSAESGRRLAHDAVLLMLHDAVDMCDSPDYLWLLPASKPSYKLFAALRLAASCWSGKHALLFYMWTFSDHSATKQLLLDIDVAFGHPIGTFMKKTEAINRYWYKLFHMPAQQTSERECARQMKDAFREFEKLLLAYNKLYASVVWDSGVAAQAGGGAASAHSLYAHYGLWALVPEIYNAVDNTDHHQMMADTRSSKINGYLEVFHAIQMACGSKSYMLFTQSSVVMSYLDSEAVNEAVRNLCAKCGLPREAFDEMSYRASLGFLHYVNHGRQDLLPGAEGTNERLSAMRSSISSDDEAFIAVQKYLTRRQSHIRLLYHGLAGRAGAAEPEPVKEQVEKEDRVSASRTPRRSLGGA